MVKTNPSNISTSKNNGKRIEVFIEEKGKAEKGRSTSTFISILSDADRTVDESESDTEYTRIIKKTKVKRSIVKEESDASKRQHIDKTVADAKKKNNKLDDVEETQINEVSSPVVKKEKIKVHLIEKDLKKKRKLIFEDEDLIDEEDREYLKSKKFQELKNSLKQDLLKGELLSDKIDHKLYKASILYPEDDQLKKIIKKRNKLFCKSYICGKKDHRDSVYPKDDFNSTDLDKHGGYNESEDDIWVDNGKSIVPFDDSYLLDSDSSFFETQLDENGKSEEIECERGYINEDLGFNEIKLQEIEDLIPEFEKGYTNNKRKKFNTVEVLGMINKQLGNDVYVEQRIDDSEFVNDLTQVMSSNVNISDMRIEFTGYEQPGIEGNDVETATASKNDGQIYDEPKGFHDKKLKLIQDEENYKARSEFTLDEYAIKAPNNVSFLKQSTFHGMKVSLHKALAEDEKKLAEFMWRASNNESDIVFKIKDLQAELGIFETLFPEVKVSASIIDIWSLVLNHEENYRYNKSGGGNIYCSSGMLNESLIGDDVDLIKRRKVFESNMSTVLAVTVQKFPQC